MSTIPSGEVGTAESAAEPGVSAEEETTLELSIGMEAGWEGEEVTEGGPLGGGVEREPRPERDREDRRGRIRPRARPLRARGARVEEAARHHGQRSPWRGPRRGRLGGGVRGADDLRGPVDLDRKWSRKGESLPDLFI